MNCLPEMWLVQMTKDGQYVGFFQFFHPNPEAAHSKAEEMRADPELHFVRVHVGRYVLAHIEKDPRP